MINTIKGWFGNKKKGASVSSGGDGGGGIPFNMDAQIQDALSVPVFARSIDIMATLTAQIMTSPGALSVVDRNGNKVDNRRTREILDFMVDNNEEFWHGMATDMFIYGTAISRPVGIRSDNVPLRMERMDMSDVECKWVRNQNGGGGSWSYDLRPANVDQSMERKAYSQSDLYIAFWSRTYSNFFGLGSNNNCRGLGVSPLTALRKTIAIASNADDWLYRLFDTSSGSSAMQDTYISVPDSMTAELFKQFARSIKESDRKGLPLILGNDGKAGSIGGTDRQRFISELGIKTQADIAKIYGVSAPLLQEASQGWGSSYAQQARFAFRFGLKPTFDKLLRPFNESLLTQGRQFSVFPKDFFRGDSADMLRIRKALEGIATNKEIRDLFGLSPDVPDGMEDDETDPQNAGADDSRGGLERDRPDRERETEGS